MKPGLVLVVFIVSMVLYFIVLCLKLDKIDIVSIYYYIRYVLPKGVSKSSFSTKLRVFFLVIITPFLKKTTIEHLSQGGIYTSYIYKFHPELARKMDDKLFWYQILNQYQIAHPRVLAYSNDRDVILLSNINSEENYLSKPRFGMLGLDVKKVSGYDIKHNFDKNVIYQDILFDCLVEKSRHFRYVSLYDGRPFRLYQYMAGDSKSATSVSGTNTWIIPCSPNDCPYLTYQAYVEIRDMMNKLSQLHKALFSEIFSIGWDIMIHCDEKNSEKAYCLEGNTLHATWSYLENINERLVSNYKNECYLFLKKRGYFYFS